MPRTPHALRTLLDQLREVAPKLECEPHGDVDGLDVHRTVRFDKASSKKLAPILEVLDDPRVRSANLSKAGYLQVEFTDRPAADFTQPFPVEDAVTVARQSPAASRRADESDGDS